MPLFQLYILGSVSPLSLSLSLYIDRYYLQIQIWRLAQLAHKFFLNEDRADLVSALAYLFVLFHSFKRAHSRIIERERERESE